MIKRYQPALLSNSVETPDGEYVKYEDYQTLEAENASLTQRIAELESENEQLYKSIRLINTAVSYYPIQYTVEIMSKEVRKITEAVIKREPNE